MLVAGFHVELTLHGGIRRERNIGFSSMRILLIKPRQVENRGLARKVQQHWRPATAITNSVSAVGFSAMNYAANLKDFRIRAYEEEPIVTNAKAKFISSFQSFHIAGARFSEPMQRC